jgi:CheY-like chemotaxis protein
MLDEVNRRILIVDDQKSIHNDFRLTLDAKEIDDDSLRHASASLFGDNTSDHPKEETYCLDSAYQGEEAVACVQRAIDDGCPYALAFVDIRMPPGMDGIETIECIWKIDERIQIVICTAFTDYSWNEIQRRLRDPERFLILRKPFEIVEVRQLASFLTMKWHRSYASEAADELRLEG